MKVNGVDTDVYGIQEWKIEPGFSEIVNESEWTPLPLLLKGRARFKTIKVSVLIKGNTREEIWEKSGSFIAKLLDPCVYQFQGFQHFFYMYLKNAEQAEMSLQRWHKATLELAGYEYGQEVSFSHTAPQGRSMILFNKGNLNTPAVVEVLPVINLASLKISGLVRNETTGEEKSILIRNLINGKKIIIDGENGLITQEGENKYHETDLWDLPSLLPGENSITVDKDVNLLIRFKPRYL